MNTFIIYPPLATLVKISWHAAVLILLVLAVQRVFGWRLSPRWRYTLWFLVVIRLALPWSLPAAMSLFNVLNQAESSTIAAGVWPSRGVQPAAPTTPALAQTGAPAQAVAVEPASAPSAFGAGFPWPLAVWAAGAGALSMFLLVTHWRLSRRVGQRRPLIDAQVLNLLEDCKQQMRVRVPLTLVETPQVGSPALFGFVRPVLLLPPGLTQSFSLQELRYVFLHELGHIKRHDILVGWLVTALQIVHWFNPLVWLAFHRMRVDRELACDALALSRLQPQENQSYGQTIIKLLESFGRSTWAPSVAGTVENRTQTKERISMIAKYNNTNRGAVLAAALFAGLGLITLTDAEPATSEVRKQLIGTWILAGRPGEPIGPAPAEGGRLKSWTDSHWSMTQIKSKNGVVLFHHGGSYTLKGNEYTEHVEFANESTAENIGHVNKFRMEVKGDTLNQIGLDNPWKEVWKRTTTNKPRKLEVADLQGAWTGHEGDNGQDDCSLVVNDATFEFHSGNKEEWYKATFAAYDSNPKQLVIVINDCPSSALVGITAYAIYQSKDGTLTITGNAPGSPTVPGSFDAPHARKFVFKRK